jgi:alpha-beta hydrolase superfamily lysophospholipase
MTEIRELRTEWGEVRAERVSFRSQGVELAGLVTYPLPKRAPRLPGVVLVPGPGAVDADYSFPRMRLVFREGALAPEEPPARDWAIRPYKEIAECLGARGFITLRYDKRGVGRSGGAQEEWTLDRLAADVIAALALLKARGDVDPERLFLLGHSEGGVIASMIAGDLGYLAGLLLLATPLTPVHRLASRQTEHVLRLAGYSETAIAASRAQIETDHAAILAGTYAAASYSDLPVEHWRSLMRHRALPALRRVPHATRVLLIQGGKDWQVPPSETLSIGSALLAAGHPDVELHLFPGLDHFLLEESGLSRPETYFARRRRLPGYLLETLSAWLTRQST